MDRVLIIIIKLHERWLDRGRCRQIIWEVAYVNSSFVKFERDSLKCLSSGWATIYKAWEGFYIIGSPLDIHSKLEGVFVKLTEKLLE
jgi:hypothetical protein